MKKLYNPENITPWLGREIRTKSGSTYLVTIRGELMNLNDGRTPVRLLEAIGSIPSLYREQFENVSIAEAKTLLRIYGEMKISSSNSFLAAVLDGNFVCTTSKIEKIL